MKIGFILPGDFVLTIPGNGIRAQAEYQADAMTQLGHEVIRMNPWQDYSDKNFDVVQFFLGGFRLFGIETLKNETINTLVFAPIIDSNEPNWRYRLAVKAGNLLPKIHTTPSVFRDQAQGSDLVVCRSNYEKRRVTRGLGISESKAKIILNGVTPPIVSDPEPAHQQWKLPDEFLLHVSAFTESRKNVIRLIEAAGTLGYPLVIAGGAQKGPTLDRIHALAARYGNVTILGFVNRILLESLYAACKVFCLPSTHEGTGLVALEAAAHGARVVITQNGGPPDYFLNYAEYVNPDDINSIRKGIETAWHQSQSDALRQHVLKNLTWEASARSLVSAYEGNS